MSSFAPSVDDRLHIGATLNQPQAPVLCFKKGDGGVGGMKVKHPVMSRRRADCCIDSDEMGEHHRVLALVTEKRDQIVTPLQKGCFNIAPASCKKSFEPVAAPGKDARR